MSSVQPNVEQLSLKLSEVLEDIGVNDEIIQKRRQCFIFEENVFNVQMLIEGRFLSHFRFGSQCEGTTTIGLDSDEDFMTTNDNFIVIDDLSNWQIGKRNLLMVQDETTAPGYCLLQLLREYVPLPAQYVPDDDFCMDDKRRTLAKHTFFDKNEPFVQHGPAATLKLKGMREVDDVIAYRCSTWPVEAKKWLTRDNVDGWPNASLKSECEKSGCFLVPVDNKISGLVGKEIEWRISTSLAERHLMFSLNITHLKCYVIMKLMLKKYDVFHDVISSYMCKTVLLYCVENTKGDFWQDKNLVVCLNKLLSELYNNIANLNCPHFIIPENNLMAGRISPSQQQRLLKELEQFIGSECRMLLDVQIDDLGERLRQKLCNVPEFSLRFKSKIEMHRCISDQLTGISAKTVIEIFTCSLIHFIGSGHLNAIKNLRLKYQEIRNLYAQFDITKRKAARYFTSLIRTTVGTLMASHSISTQRSMTSDSIMNQTVFGKNTTLEWLESGLKSDVSSSRLKLATVYYSTENMNAAKYLLNQVDQKYDRNVVKPVCGCNCENLEIAADNRQVTKFRQIVSYCVCFMNHDINIVPLELRQEFSRSSQEELQRRDLLQDQWMSLAVIDSLPYLYFLQYKTYSSLRENENKQNALEKLKNVTNEEPERLRHTETVYNLLGQCMEQENRPNDALKYYQQSLQIRPEHNAANFYISRLKR